MAQELLSLLPRVITQDGWPEGTAEQVDAKIRDDPSLLRLSPEFPFHRILHQRAPLSVIQTCLEVDPDIVTLNNEQGQLPIEQTLAIGAPLEAGVFDLLFQASVAAISDLVSRVSPTNGCMLLHRACTGACVSLEIVQTIYEAHPRALMHRNQQGNLPGSMGNTELTHIPGKGCKSGSTLAIVTTVMSS